VNDAWYPWLKGELTKEGMLLLTADFPENDDLEGWRKKVQEHLSLWDGNSMIIGHCFGAELPSSSEFKSRTIAAYFLLLEN
jgi:predicted alpha/beta hydrolase family esterase